jgi:hypothetical protein
MQRRRLEVADVLRKHGSAYLEQYSSSAEQRRVLRDLSLCRTAALGGYKLKCDSCGHEEISYCSCRNRHCPKCQGGARADWLRARAADLLDGVKYFHIVFTLPDKLGPIALQNKRVVYGILFRAVSETLRTIGRDRKHLGAEIGFLAVLHTWGQTVLHHPHIHCVVPGGGISPDGKRWISSRKNFFVSVRVLSRLFRRKFLAYLREAFMKGKLSFHGKLKDLKDPEKWNVRLQAVKKRDWVVFAKRPFGGPKQVLKYLARYTHRVAISNQRLISIEGGRVTFRWKDYAHGSRQREMTLKAEEFIRRFLVHVLPNGFHRIRHYGFLANRVRKEKLELSRRLLSHPVEPAPETEPTADATSTTETTEPATSACCPLCQNGRMMLAGKVQPDLKFSRRILAPEPIDTS